MGAHDLLRAIFGAEGTPKPPVRNRGDSGDTVTAVPKTLKMRQNPVTEGPQKLSPALKPAVTGITGRGDSHFPQDQRVTGSRHPVTASPAEFDMAAAALSAIMADELDAFEERAAILEFDAGMPRREAERLAAGELASQRRR